MFLITDLDNDPYQTFVVFHDNGYTMYDPASCHGYRQVAAMFSLLTNPQRSGRLEVNFPTWRQLCPFASGETAKCIWGDSVNVQNKYIYVSQPELNRLVVIDIRDQHKPVEVSVSE